eukprot:13765600-Heterocapsa_arctica.AAC.1
MDKDCPRAPPAPGGWSAALKAKAATTPPTIMTKGKGKSKCLEVVELMELVNRSQPLEGGWMGGCVCGQAQ